MYTMIVSVVSSTVHYQQDLRTENETANRRTKNRGMFMKKQRARLNTDHQKRQVTFNLHNRRPFRLVAMPVFQPDLPTLETDAKSPTRGFIR